VARLFTARGGLPPALLAVAELTSAEIAVRSLRTAVARRRSAGRSMRPNARACPRSSLGASQRTVQRALGELEAAGRVRSIGRARARRWLSPPLAGFTTNLLLPAGLPLG
jgi:DNA-binding transcriptional MocR family regulator